MSISAMKQALEALEWNYGTDLENIENCTAWLDKLNATIPALRQAIEQAEKQEPVAQAWDEGYRTGINDERMSEANIGIAGFGAKVEPARNNPYRTPPAAPVHARPVVHAVRCTYPQCQATNGCVGACSKTAPVHASDISQECVDETAKRGHELAGTIPISNGGIATRTPSSFISPPKRKWVGLSDKEVKKIVDKNTSDIWCSGKGIARDVEAKLKEKNT